MDRLIGQGSELRRRDGIDRVIDFLPVQERTAQFRVAALARAAKKQADFRAD
jgi:hypothetical protein